MSLKLQQYIDEEGEQLALKKEKQKQNKELEEQRKLEEDYTKKLEVLQYKIKRNPELYLKEVSKYKQDFLQFFEEAKLNPMKKNKKLAEVCVFLARMGRHFKEDLSFLGDYIQEYVNNYVNQMNAFLRKKMVSGFMILRSENLVGAVAAMKFFFPLFGCQSKQTRRFVQSYVVSDLKKLNRVHRNEKVNKQVQIYLHEIVLKQSNKVAKSGLQVAIKLYKKNIWNNAKIVNIIAAGCFNEYYKVKLVSAYFLLETTEQKLEEDSSDEEDQEVEEKEKGGERKGIFSKKTKWRLKQVEKDKKKALRKNEKKLSKSLVQKNFFPIDLIFNPQDFVEKVFGVLKKSNEKFQVKLVLVALLSRMIGRHKLILMPFYTYLQKYLFPTQKEVVKMLAYLAESVHENVPPYDLENVIKHVIDNFVNDRCSEESMTQGLNTVREICSRNRVAVDEFSLNYLCDFYKFKNKNVSKAAKALINLFRNINPGLLNKKYRGRNHSGAQDPGQTETEIEILKYGQQKISNSIRGTELIDLGGEIPIAMDQILSDEDFKKIKFLQQKKIEREMEEKNRLNLERAQARIEQEMEQEEEYIEISDDDDDEESEPKDKQQQEIWEDVSSSGEEDEEEGEGEEILDFDSADLVNESQYDSEDSEDDEDEEDQKKKTEQKNQNDQKMENEEDLKKKNLKRRAKKLEKELEGFSSFDEDDVEEDEDNPHGFVDPQEIARFKMAKKEKRILLKEKLKDRVKEKYYTGPKEKGGGTNNEKKLKNKPLEMLRPKKNFQSLNQLGIKAKIRNLKNQLGHVRSGKQAQRKKRQKMQ